MDDTNYDASKPCLDIHTYDELSGAKLLALSLKKMRSVGHLVTADELEQAAVDLDDFSLRSLIVKYVEFI